MNIDEIYELFIWDESYTDEEYAAREKRGIEEASKLKNLYPFIQPMIIPPEKSKSVWEPCAKVIALKSDSELMPFLHLLFEWLQDMNWPGAEVIFERLAQMPYPMLEQEFRFSKTCAERENDEVWLMWLEAFEKRINPSGIELGT